MSLFRVPFLLDKVFAFDKSLTPPTPYAPASDRVAVTSLAEKILYSYDPRGTLLLNIAKIAAWIPIASETAVILAYHQVYPQPMNSYILHILTNGGGGKHIGPIAQKVSLSLVLGTLTVMWGIWLRTSAHKALGRHFTFHVSLQKDHTLITDWPYNVVRHPGYTGAFMVYGSLATVLAGTDTWARAFFWGHLGMQGGLIGAFVFLAIALPVMRNSLAVVMLFKRMAAEDKMLHQRFGPKWDRWAQDVPYKLVPWMY